MGGIGSGPPRGIKYQKRNHLRLVDARNAIKLDVWKFYRDGLLTVKSTKMYDGYRVASRIETSELVRLEFSFEAVRKQVHVHVYHFDRGYLPFDFKFTCPECSKTARVVYYHDAGFGCRKCAGVYYRTRNDKATLHMVARDYKYAREVLDKYRAIYDDYQKSGRAWPWKQGRLNRPSKMRRRIASLQRRALHLEALLWNAAERKFTRGAAERKFTRGTD